MSSKRSIRYSYPLNVRLDIETAELARQVAGLEGATLSGFIRASIVRNVARIRRAHKAELVETAS
jgi:hypothetical protein